MGWSPTCQAGLNEFESHMLLQIYVSLVYWVCLSFQTWWVGFDSLGIRQIRSKCFRGRQAPERNLPLLSFDGMRIDWQILVVRHQYEVQDGKTSFCHRPKRQKFWRKFICLCDGTEYILRLERSALTGLWVQLPPQVPNNGRWASWHMRWIANPDNWDRYSERPPISNKWQKLSVSTVIGIRIKCESETRMSANICLLFIYTEDWQSMVYCPSLLRRWF